MEFTDLSDLAFPSSDTDQARLAIAANAALGHAASLIMARAGSGELESQRQLFRNRVNLLFDPSTPNSYAMLIAMEAVMYGRLIASHGNPADVRCFAGALCQASTIFNEGKQYDLSNEFMAETVCVLEHLAEAGDDVAALTSNELARDKPPEFFDYVRMLRQRGEEQS